MAKPQKRWMAYHPKHGYICPPHATKSWMEGHVEVSFNAQFAKNIEIVPVLITPLKKPTERKGR